MTIRPSRQPAARQILCAVCGVALLLGASGSTRIRVIEPWPNTVLEAPGGEITVRGRARGPAELAQPLDLVLVLDVSHSTRLASGHDVDEDGDLGVVRGRLGSTDPDDTVLAAEVAAGRALVAGLANPKARIGLVTFSGASDKRTGLRLRPDQADAWIRAPLTEDRDAVTQALDLVLEEGSHGATNFEAGIRQATAALLQAGESPAERAVLFLTDGLPSFPIGRADVSDPGDLERAFAAAEAAAAESIRIHAFALGPDALAEPDAAVAIAQRTGGSFTALPRPGQIIEVLGHLAFGGSGRLRATNLEDGAHAHALEMRPDGRFVARIRVVPGRNRIRVEAGEPPVHLDIPVVVRPEREPRTRRRLQIEVEPEVQNENPPGSG